MPFFSAIIPTKNRAKFLGKAIQSVLDQTYRNFELIVVDNGSEDGTSEILSTVHDPRLVVHRQDKPVPIKRNWATGLSISRGDYAAFLSDDDLWHEDFLSVAAHILQTKESIDLLFFDHWIVDAEGRVLFEETCATSARFGRSQLPYGIVDDFLSVTIEKQPVSMNSAVYRRTAIQSLPAWSDPAVGRWADYPLNAQLAIKGCVAFYVPLRLGYYRRHDGGFTASTGDKARMQQYLTSEAHVCDQLLAHKLPSHVRSFLEEKRWKCLRHLAHSYLLSGEVGKACELFESLGDANVAGSRLVHWSATLLKRLNGRPWLFRPFHKVANAAAVLRSWWLA